jgi:GAF domain-containing protein
MSDSELYDRLHAQVSALLDGETDFVANAGNFAALVAHELPEVNWAGFYLATPSGDLVLGPFSGRPACTRIAAGRGVCGAAAQKRETLVVPDVNAFADHIVCDSASRSEIVVPLFTHDATLFAVFDVDSPVTARFTDADRRGLERLVRAFSEALPAPLHSER